MTTVLVVIAAIAPGRGGRLRCSPARCWSGFRLRLARWLRHHGLLCGSSGPGRRLPFLGRAFFGGLLRCGLFGGLLRGLLGGFLCALFRGFLRRFLGGLLRRLLGGLLLFRDYGLLGLFSFLGLLTLLRHLVLLLRLSISVERFE